MSGFGPITSASPRTADVNGQGAGLPPLTQAVLKLYFGDRDEILSHEVGLLRNNDSAWLSSGFSYCAKGLGIRVFTQSGPERTSPQLPFGSFTCTRLEGLCLHANSIRICNLGKRVRPAKRSRMAYGTSSKDGTWHRNDVQALASACCEVARSCFNLHDEP